MQIGIVRCMALRRQAGANYSGIGPLVSGERDSAVSRAGAGRSAVAGRRADRGPASRLPRRRRRGPGGRRRG